MQRFQSVLALLAGSMILLLIWMARLPARPADRIVSLSATSTPLAQPGSTPVEAQLQFEAADLGLRPFYEAESYLLPVRVSNAGERRGQAQLFLEWQHLQQDWRRSGGLARPLDIPPGDDSTLLFELPRHSFPGPGHYTYTARLRLTSTSQPPGLIRATGVVHILPREQLCSTPPNLRLLGETATWRRGTLVIFVRNEGQQAYRQVRVQASWGAGQHSSFTIPELLACRGEGRALLRMPSSGPLPETGAAVSISVTAAEGAPAEQRLDDNEVTLTVP